MSYRSYLNRKILKNKFNFIPLIILIVMVLVCLVFNVKNKAANSYIVDAKDNIRQGKQALQDSQNDLKRKKLTVSDRKLDLANIANEKKDIKINQTIIRLSHQHQWRAAYQQKVRQIQEDLTVAQASKGSGSGLINAMKRDRLIYQDLASKNLEKQDDDFPTQGISYSVWASKTILPYLLVLAITFVLVQVYGDAFEGKLNKNKLLPISKVTITTQNILNGSFFAIVLWLLTELTAFIAGTVVSGIGALNYPYLSYAIGSGKMLLQNISKLILPSLILQGLAIVFIVEITYFIVTLVRNRLAALFVILLLTLGLILVTTVVEPLRRIAAFLPTTYINGISIVSGQYGHAIANNQISFVTGVITLLIGIVGLYGFTLVMNTKLKKF